MSVQRASEAYSFPACSLHDRSVKFNKVKNVILAPDMGTFKMTFSDEQEEDFAAYIKNLESWLSLYRYLAVKSWDFLQFRLPSTCGAKKTMQVTSVSQGIN
jgi:hypothetical protein